MQKLTQVNSKLHFLFPGESFASSFEVAKKLFNSKYKGTNGVGEINKQTQNDQIN